MSTPELHSSEPAIGFRSHWQNTTSDSNLTLHGFRRFKTAHLLNLRFLEADLAKVDHAIYQAGLSLHLEPPPYDRLGLRHCKRDAHVPGVEEVITQDQILNLRSLIKQYDEALAAFNNIMAMETFSLLDDEKQASLRTDLTLPEIYNTRLLRTDLRPRTRTDPFERWIHRRLRAFRYWRLSSKAENTPGGVKSSGRGRFGSHQNSVLIATVLGRVLTSLTTGVFLVLPLAILSAGLSRTVQLLIVSVCIIIFSFFVAAMLRVSNFEMMAVSAAYAAVLSVFVSGVPEVTA